MEDLNINFGNLKVDQLGFVFKDIEKQAEIMQSLSRNYGGFKY